MEDEQEKIDEITSLTAKQKVYENVQEIERAAHAEKNAKESELREKTI